MRWSIIVAVILAAAVLGEAGSPAAQSGCSIPSGGWKAASGSSSASVAPAQARRLLVLVNAYRRENGLHAVKLGSRLALYAPGKCGSASAMRAWRASPSARRVLLSRNLTAIRFVSGTSPLIVVAPPKAKPAGPPDPVIPPATPTSPPIPAGPGPEPVVVGVPYTCSGPVDNVRVVGTGTSGTALVNLAAGCTGTISFDIEVSAPGGGDGVKVQDGAHDLVVGPSHVVCDPGVPGSMHQDGVQVQGGVNVTFNGLVVSCPSSPGAAAFYIDGKNFKGIQNVVCDGCDLEHNVVGALFTAPAPGSGVINSIIHQGTITSNYYAKDGTGYVDEGNTLVPR